MPARKPKKPGRRGFQPSLRDLRHMKWPPPTLAQAAKELEISESHLSGVELAQQPASPRLLFRIAVFYGLDRKSVLAAYSETQRRHTRREADPQV